MNLSLNFFFKNFIKKINNILFIKFFNNINFTNIQKYPHLSSLLNLFSLIILKKKKSNFYKLFYNNFYFFFLQKKKYKINILIYKIITNKNLFLYTFYFLKKNFKKIFTHGFVTIKGLLLIFILDALITDDEPLWEPIEWSLIQTWLFFIFTFAWIAENLITSRFGSYTGRDKRIWFAWYKTFWLIELWYALSFGSTCMLVITPFYYELTYSLSYIFSWWNWYNRIFFFKFISIYTIIIIISLIFQINIKWLNWKNLLFFIIIINIFIGYLLYTQFIISFFSYFTDPLWYQKTRFIDYVQLSHEPLKWGWGPSKRDHFTYHKVSTVFWFKNDGPFAEAFLIMNLFIFLTLFFLFIYWITLLRKSYTTEEITFTFSTYCISALKQFYYFFFLLYIFIFISFIVCYWRFPIEFLWLINANSWIFHLFSILCDYKNFLVSII